MAEPCIRLSGVVRHQAAAHDHLSAVGHAAAAAGSAIAAHRALRQLQAALVEETGPPNGQVVDQFAACQLHRSSGGDAQSSAVIAVAAGEGEVLEDDPGAGVHIQDPVQPACVDHGSPRTGALDGEQPARFVDIQISGLAVLFATARYGQAIDALAQDDGLVVRTGGGTEHGFPQRDHFIGTVHFVTGGAGDGGSREGGGAG